MLSYLTELNSKIMLITGDLGFGVFDDYARKFPNNFLNVGVAEQNMTGIATGIALEGRVVFTYSIANFPILRCLEQIRNGPCYHQANVNIVSIGGGFSYGPLGFSHHATEDLSIMRSLPDITVFAPGDLWEASQATKAMANTKVPGYLRLDKSYAENTTIPNETFQVGIARRLREGNDLTLISTGGILGVVLRAADNLAEYGIHCRVLSMHTLKPFDIKALIEASSETGGIITIEENTIEGGLGSLVAEKCLDLGMIPKSFYRIGLKDGFSSIVGSQNYLRKVYGIDEEAIVSTALALVNIRKPVLKH